MPVKSPFAVFKCLYPFAVPHHLFVLLCSFHDVLAILSTQEAGIDRPAVFVSSCHLCLELLTSIHFNSLHWQNRGVEINLFRKAEVSLFSALWYAVKSQIIIIVIWPGPVFSYSQPVCQYLYVCFLSYRISLLASLFVFQPTHSFLSCGSKPCCCTLALLAAASSLAVASLFYITTGSQTSSVF